MLVVPPDKPISSLINYLKCFDSSQGATLTVYARQPVAGSPDTWKIGPNGRPDVGHAFLSITQNSITRVLGFYPASDGSPIGPVTSIMGDDGQHPFDVSITTPITPASLNAMLNYLYGSLDNLYSLQYYNCTNVVISAATQAGLVLPNTPGTWVGIFGGSNPGNLGQDMRNMTLPAGARRNLVGGTAPTNTGSCW